MDIMIDTNIIISAALFPNHRMSRFLFLVSEENNLFICSYTFEEIERVVLRKFPLKEHDIIVFFRRLRYTRIDTPNVDILGEITVRDSKDNPILASAIFANADILITGDRDFDTLNLERPKIMNISEYIEKYG